MVAMGSVVPIKGSWSQTDIGKVIFLSFIFLFCQMEAIMEFSCNCYED